MNKKPGHRWDIGTETDREDEARDGETGEDTLERGVKLKSLSYTDR